MYQYWMAPSGASPARGRLLPAQRTPAERTDGAAHPLDVRRVEIVGHPAWLVPADVDVRAREDLGNPGQHLLHQLQGRGQLRVEPGGVVLVPGWELELDLVAPGVQLRTQPHQRGGVPGRVDLGDDGDEAVGGVGGQGAQVAGAVEAGVGLRAVGRPAHGQASALVVGQVQVQHIELVEGKQIDHPRHREHAKLVPASKLDPTDDSSNPGSPASGTRRSPVRRATSSRIARRPALALPRWRCRQPWSLNGTRTGLRRRRTAPGPG